MERLQLFQSPDIGFTGCDEGALGCQVGRSLVSFLWGDGLLLEKIVRAGGGDCREVEIGLRVIQIGAGLLELLIHLGRLDLREHVALFHMGADIDVEVPFTFTRGARLITGDQKRTGGQERVAAGQPGGNASQEAANASSELPNAGVGRPSRSDHQGAAILRSVEEDAVTRKMP